MKSIKALYFNNLSFQIAIGIALLAIAGYALPFLESIARILSLVFLAFIFVDIATLFRVKKGLIGQRFVPERLSNGDQNLIRIYVENLYPFKAKLRLIDEVPEQFQMRKADFWTTLSPAKNTTIDYNLRPVKRGEYEFGRLNIFVSSPIGLVSRRFKFLEPSTVPVYPSYIQLRKFELLAISNNLTELGIKKIRRIGHNMEFEQIKEYVAGDDFRTINWKATARKGQLMVNNYQDERSQQVYSVIDKGRVMEMPFEGMSLLDYAINAALVISNIAMKKGDKAGLITFQHKIGTILPASKRNKQMELIMETLYNQKTAYKESDFSRLFVGIQKKLNQRSLLLLYTNFESLSALQRQLPYLRSLSKNHLVVAIFFRNTEMKEVLENKPTNVKEIYRKTVAEKFDHEKRLIVKELRRHGVYSVLTTPENLTVDSINKYLELKARGLI